MMTSQMFQARYTTKATIPCNFNVIKEKGLSQQALEFVQTCLVVDPAKRPQFEEVLEHPWLKEMAEHPHVSEIEHV